MTAFHWREIEGQILHQANLGTRFRLRTSTKGSWAAVPDLRLCLYWLLGLPECGLGRADEHGGLKLTANARAALMSRLAGVPGVSTLPPALTGVVPGAGMPGVPADFSCSTMPCLQQGVTACACATSLHKSPPVTCLDEYFQPACGTEFEGMCAAGLAREGSKHTGCYMRALGACLGS